MALSVDTVTGVPGVYRHAAERSAGFPRQRTDVVGFVGVAGPERLGELVAIDDWRGYERVFLRDERGRPLAPPPGSRLAESVHAFFANGGARCWIVNIGDRIESGLATALLRTMLGDDGASGLELLLTRREIAIVVLPELEAWVRSDDSATVDAPIAENSRFRCCAAVRDVAPVQASRLGPASPLFQPDQVLAAQRQLVERVGRVKWRAFALVTVPAGRSAAEAMAWRDALIRNLADTDAAALYWPWVQAHDRPGAPVSLRPPLGHVAGIYARRDLGRGPHVAPANETLIGVVGTELTVDDETHGRVYASAVNVLRPFGSAGVQVWGARTLLWPGDGDPLGWVNVRRCLTAIERSCDVIGQGVVFEPNQPMLRFQLAQAIFAYLMELLQAGAFKGDTPETSFFVRCDANNNPRARIEQGELHCDVGVAIAEPAEFIVFRIGRRDGVIEIQEAH